MRLARMEPCVSERVCKVPKPDTQKRPQIIPELECLRDLTGAQKIYLFMDSSSVRPRFLAASPADAVARMPDILVEGDYHFVRRAGCTFAFKASGLTLRLGEPSTLCRTPNGRSVEQTMAKVLGRLILRDENSVLRQVFDHDPAALAISSRLGFSLIKEAETVAGSQRPVIIFGESGVGKELMTRFIHQLSGRTKFVGNSMAQLRGESAVSELFGHVEGAYTGATTRRLGAFLEAGDGTLFLDEIGDLPDSAAALLLRAIEEKAVKPLGSDRTFTTSARVLAATNRPERLRKDLFYRFVHRIVIPPLRDRPADIRAIAQLVAHREGFGLSEKGLAALEVISPWKGNARELEYFLLQMVTTANKRMLGVTDVMKTYANTFTLDQGLERDRSAIRGLRLHLGLGIRDLSNVLRLPKSTLHDIETTGISERETELLIRIGENLDLLKGKLRQRKGAISEFKRFIRDE